MRWARCFTVDFRRSSRCSADHVLATLQTVTGTVVWSRAGGGKLRRAHGTVALDGADEPDEVSLDAQPRDDGCAVTARLARRSAQFGRLVGEFSPQCHVAVQPRLGVWHSRTCGECHTPKSQAEDELRARRCGASSPTKFRMGFRPFVDYSSHLSELRAVKQASSRSEEHSPLQELKTTVLVDDFRLNSHVHDIFISLFGVALPIPLAI